MAIIKKDSGDHDWEVDLGKLLLMGACLLGMTIMGIVGVVAAETIVAFYTAFFGYLAGNGVNAVRGNTQRGIVGDRNARNRNDQEEEQLDQ